VRIGAFALRQVLDDRLDESRLLLGLRRRELPALGQSLHELLVL
jgi:hypothetical protein